MSNRRLITEHCLIAADIDKTILEQNSTEKNVFIKNLAPELIKSAEMGMSLAFVTGNSMEQITNRFIKWLIQHLCYCNSLHLINKFHFFCNSGGVYFKLYLPEDELVKYKASCHKDLDFIFNNLTEKVIAKNCNKNDRIIFSHFIDVEYLMKTRIPEEEVGEIINILKCYAQEYYSEVKDKKNELSEKYILNKESFKKPIVESRPIRYIINSVDMTAHVQLTIKPILSFKHGKTEEISLT